MILHKPKSFYVYLNKIEPSKEFHISDLLEHCLEGIKQDPTRPIVLDHFYTIPSMADDGEIGIYYEFSLMDKTSIKIHRQAARLNEEVGIISEYRPTVEWLSEHAAKLKGVRIRLQGGEDQSDGIELIYHVSKWLREQHIQIVIDLIYHNYDDEDGLSRPYVDVYWHAT